ncbi:MAG: Do family serine endopeptidase [Verrucomicrobia bacterium]|nr:Do family serine endopeptidase [Verrucomicrobiota bacterium]
MKTIWKMMTVAVAGSAVLFGVGAERASMAAEPAAPPPAVATANALSDAFAWVAERVKPAVVSIIATKYINIPRSHRYFFDPFSFNFEDEQDTPRRGGRGGGGGSTRRFKQEGLGSGFIIEKDGYILTAQHVVKGVDELKVFMADKREFTAKVIGTDAKTDLAVIKINGKDLPTVSLGDSQTLRVGDWVIAIGSPYGLPQTVTAGIVSAKSRQGVIGSRDGYEDFIQTDAAINQGNSGGPLVNLRGEVVGINDAIYSESGANAGIGFAVPSAMARQVLPSLRAGKTVQRGQLGVLIQDLNEDLAQQFGLKQTTGVLVGQVTKDSAAEKAGIQRGDVIVKYNGEAVEDVNGLRNRVAATAPGVKTPVELIRKGKTMTLTVTVGDAATSTASAATEEATSEKKSLGLSVSNLTDDLAKKLGHKDEKGVVVTDVDANSAAYEKGIREGDLILEVNNQPVVNVGEFDKAVAAKKGGALLLVKSKDGSRFVVIKMK